MLTVTCRGVIQESLDAVSDIMGIEKTISWCEAYILSLLRVSAYKTVSDVYESGKLPSLFNKGSLRKLSPSPIKHPLYTMD